MRSVDDSDFGMSWLMSTFHADWTRNGPTAAEAVEYQFWDELDPESVFAVRRDAALLLCLPSATIEVLWLACTATGPSFFSEERTGVSSGTVWIETLVNLCDIWLSGHAGADEVVAVPAEWDGVELTDTVLAEIGAADFLPVEVVSALTECVRSCTPDLAFRLLLRAVQQIGTESGAALSPEHYARLAALGSALQYGEFVVSEVQHLVV
ncbi:hypothetical protein [Streptomyces sp. NPDC005374]|uniref:hypothetical protein n=1 Tax=Streptomyces sp. NPDC005374 TaxID=3364713 RepID=UPI0036CABB01